MTDQTTETVTTPATETVTETTTQTPPPATGESAEDRIARMEAALKKANAEAAKYRKAAEAQEQAEQARKNAELSEMEKLKKQLAETAAEAAKLKRAELQRQAAEKHKLPAALATRLQGETLEELDADAEELAKTLPKANPTLPPTNPGAGGAPGETDAQKRVRLFGGNVDPFDPEYLRQNGGGVFFKE